MKKYSISNEHISIEVNCKGAELVSLKKIETKQEYMWSGDPYFWNKTSPILFPVVGCHKDFKYEYQGQIYELGQHGFARDMNFECILEQKNEIWFQLKDSEETRKVYPFRFCLEIGYKLLGTKVEVIWNVKNIGNDTLHFSIGGHPGFLIPMDQEDRAGAYVKMDAKSNTVRSRKIKNRLAIDGFYDCHLEDGMVAITKELFSQDALVLEDRQVQNIRLLDQNKQAFLSISFDTPIIAIWAPAHLEKKAPFVCIEPWYGRCDHENFNGTLEEREFAQSLEVGEKFIGSYEISIL